jgi:hypothetical protein
VIPVGIKGLNVLYEIRDEFQTYNEGVSMADVQNDEEDVKAALARTTQDGSGFTSEDELPKSDFESFSEPDVENNHDGDNEPAVEGTDTL